MKRSYPCKSISTDDDHVNVEMDPTDELEARKKIAQDQLICVGWSVEKAFERNKTQTNLKGFWMMI